MRLFLLIILLLCFSCEPEIEIKEVTVNLNEYLLGEWKVVENYYSITNGITSNLVFYYQNDFMEGAVNLKRVERESSVGIKKKWRHGKWWIDDENNYLHIAHQFGIVDSGIPSDRQGSIQAYVSYFSYEVNIINQNEFTAIYDRVRNDSSRFFLNNTYRRL